MIPVSYTHLSTLIFNKAPYKNVIVLGHVQDENGQKTVSYTHLDVYKRQVFTKVMAYGIAMLGTTLAAMILVGRLGTGDPSTCLLYTSEIESIFLKFFSINERREEN